MSVTLNDLVVSSSQQTTSSQDSQTPVRRKRKFTQLTNDDEATQINNDNESSPQPTDTTTSIEEQNNEGNNENVVVDDDSCRCCTRKIKGKKYDFSSFSEHYENLFPESAEREGKIVCSSCYRRCLDLRKKLESPSKKRKQAPSICDCCNEEITSKKYTYAANATSYKIVFPNSQKRTNWVCDRCYALVLRKYRKEHSPVFCACCQHKLDQSNTYSFSKHVEFYRSLFPDADGTKVCNSCYMLYRKSLQGSVCACCEKDIVGKRLSYNNEAYKGTYQILYPNSPFQNSKFVCTKCYAVAYKEKTDLKGSASCACCDQSLIGKDKYLYESGATYFKKIFPRSPIDNGSYTCRRCHDRYIEEKQTEEGWEKEKMTCRCCAKLFVNTKSRLYSEFELQYKELFPESAEKSDLYVCNNCYSKRAVSTKRKPRKRKPAKPVNAAPEELEEVLHESDEDDVEIAQTEPLFVGETQETNVIEIDQDHDLGQSLVVLESDEEEDEDDVHPEVVIEEEEDQPDVTPAKLTSNAPDTTPLAIRTMKPRPERVLEF